MCTWARELVVEDDSGWVKATHKKLNWCHGLHTMHACDVIAPLLNWVYIYKSMYGNNLFL